MDILENLFPSFIFERIKSGNKFIADEHPEVTVIFCDICDFDDICADYAPVELCELLNELWLNFDLLCENNGIYKIETVGKTYLACAGLDYDEFKDIDK